MRASVASRRDPVEVVAVNVPDVKKAAEFYVKEMGMVGRAEEVHASFTLA